MQINHKTITDEELLELAKNHSVKMTKVVDESFYGYTVHELVDLTKQFAENNKIHFNQVQLGICGGYDSGDERIQISAEVPLDISNSFDRNALIRAVQDAINAKNTRETYERRVYEEIKKKFG
jgi:hypothetical protein